MGGYGVGDFLLGDGNFLLWGLHTSVGVLNTRRHSPSRAPKMIVTRRTRID